MGNTFQPSGSMHSRCQILHPALCRLPVSPQWEWHLLPSSSSPSYAYYCLVKLFLSLSGPSLRKHSSCEDLPLPPALLKIHHKNQKCETSSHNTSELFPNSLKKLDHSCMQGIREQYLINVIFFFKKKEEKRLSWQPVCILLFVLGNKHLPLLCSFNTAFNNFCTCKYI